jgi:hypothetical protein
MGQAPWFYARIKFSAKYSKIFGIFFAHKAA